MKFTKFVERSLIVPALQSAELINARLGAKLRDRGFSITEATVLLAIFFEERECRPSDLARVLNLSRSRLSQAISMLCYRDLLQRKLESQDARFVALRITAAGRAEATKLVRYFDACNDEIESVLGVKGAEQAAAHLSQLNRGWTARDA